MKKYMRFMLSLMLCAGFLQPTLQAVPSETCAKWVARGATLIYWNFLMGPAFDKALGAMNLRVARSHIDERACDLQDIAPESYAEIQNILRQEGLPGLDGYTIKKAPKNSSGCEWAYFGGKTIIAPSNAFVPRDEHEESYASSSSAAAVPVDKGKRFKIVDCEEAAAILSHEMEHERRKHIEKRVLISAVVPLIAHTIGKAMASPQVAGAVYPSIGRSLLRIPYALAIVMPVYWLDLWYSRRTEREADAILQRSPKLAQKFSEFLKKDYASVDGKFEESKSSVWDNVHNGNLTNVGIVDRVLAPNLSKPRYIAAIKDIHGLTQTHPWCSERIAYCEKWAKEKDQSK